MMKKDQRKLVGRRYEDFIKNDISLELTLEEKIWRNTITDMRYQSLMDRRTMVRRETDREQLDENFTFRPITTPLVINVYEDIE